MRIAMWSGPRNLSTAMMRSFENRADCSVVDEPLYAAYLATTGIDHPGREDVIASQSTEWREVAAELTTGALETPLQYQKHMTHHVLEGMELDAFSGLTHAFLIRDPERVLTSYAKVREQPTLEDLGLPQQVALFESFGGPVIDAASVLASPAAALSALCTTLAIDPDPAMLTWPAGRRDSDGVWAPHWYAGVWASTGFDAVSPGAADPLPGHLEPLLEQCQPWYDRLSPYALKVSP